MYLVDTLLKKGMIRIKESAIDWKEAIKIGIGCLVSDGAAEWGYYDAIIRNVAKNGPYFTLMPGVALPHARPEEGAISTSFSLVTLDKPIDFGSPDNDPISILLSFCSNDPAEQVGKAMVEAVSLFEDENNITQMQNATTVNEMKKILQNFNSA